jgi:hypothetical protein
VSGYRWCPRKGCAPRRKGAFRRAESRSRRAREGWNSVRRALSFVPADPHILRSIRDRAPLHAQRPHDSRACPPRAPHPSALRLALSAVDAHLAGGPPRWPMHRTRLTLHARWRRILRASRAARPSAQTCSTVRSRLLCYPREAERVRARRRCSVVRMPAAIAFPAHIRGNPAQSWRLLLLPVRVPARARSCLRSVGRMTMACVVAAAEPWTMQSASFRLLCRPSR